MDNFERKEEKKYCFLFTCQISCTFPETFPVNWRWHFVLCPNWSQSFFSPFFWAKENVSPLMSLSIVSILLFEPKQTGNSTFWHFPVNDFGHPFFFFSISQFRYLSNVFFFFFFIEYFLISIYSLINWQSYGVLNASAKSTLGQFPHVEKCHQHGTWKMETSGRNKSQNSTLLFTLQENCLPFHFHSSFSFLFSNISWKYLNSLLFFFFIF